MRLVIMALAALALCGCEGMKLGMGYNIEAKQFFMQIEKPLDPSLKK